MAGDDPGAAAAAAAAADLTIIPEGCLRRIKLSVASNEEIVRVSSLRLLVALLSCSFHLLMKNFHRPSKAQGTAGGRAGEALPDHARQPASGQPLAGAASAGWQL
jgi:hypothetical protein